MALYAFNRPPKADKTVMIDAQHLGVKKIKNTQRKRLHKSTQKNGNLSWEYFDMEYLENRLLNSCL